MILRPGIITKEDLETALGKKVLLDPTLNKRPDKFNNEDFRPKAPGMKYKHYAPKAQMIVYEGRMEAVEAAIDRERVERCLLYTSVKRRLRSGKDLCEKKRRSSLVQKSRVFWKSLKAVSAFSDLITS